MVLTRLDGSLVALDGDDSLVAPRHRLVDRNHCPRLGPNLPDFAPSRPDDCPGHIFWYRHLADETRLDARRFTV